MVGLLIDAREMEERLEEDKKEGKGLYHAYLS